MQNKYIYGLVAIVIAIIAIAAFVVSGVKFGGTTNYDVLQVSKITVGSSGTGFGTVLYGTCTMIWGATIVAPGTATTTVADCSSSSFASGDYVVLLGNATTSIASTRDIVMQALGSASTTAGFAPVRVLNLSGAAITPAGSGLGSSTPFLIFRPLTTTPGL